jgi:sugar O-acyltransferase (sialic acid O-acetyltransferase NeuD family)
VNKNQHTISVLIIGTGSEAQLAAEIFETNEITVLGFLKTDEADEIKITEIINIPILGKLSTPEYKDLLINQQAQYFIAISDTNKRLEMYQQLSRLTKRLPLKAIHKNAIISTVADLGANTLVAAGAVIQPAVRIEPCCFIGPQTVIETGSNLKAGVTIQAGAVVANEVVLNTKVFVGPGAIINSKVVIGENTLIAAGAVVLQHVPANDMVFGNPAVSAHPDAQKTAMFSADDTGEILLESEADMIEHEANNSNIDWAEARLSEFLDS